MRHTMTQLPNVLTAMNLMSGVLSIFLASNGNTKEAILCIMVGMVLDMMDGRLARLLQVKGDFGKELDSLADVVTFGVAPAFLVYQVGLTDVTGILPFAITALFPVFGAWRLARFNTEQSSIATHFVGLPITAAGGILAVLTFFHAHLSPGIYLFSIAMLSFLMVSRIRHPNFKKVPLPKHLLVVAPLFSTIAWVVQKWTPATIPYILMVMGGVYGTVLISQSLYKRKHNVSGHEKKDA